MSDLPDLKQQKVPQSEFDAGAARKGREHDMPHKPKKSKSGDDKEDVKPPKAETNPTKEEEKTEEKKEEKKTDQPAQKGSSCCLLI